MTSPPMNDLELQLLEDIARLPPAEFYARWREGIRVRTGVDIDDWQALRELVLHEGRLRQHMAAAVLAGLDTARRLERVWR